MNRKLVIGDIHGGLKALVQVLERAKVSEKDTLIFLGDFVDGWSESPAVLDFLIHLKQQQNCIFIRGNHDDLLLKWLCGDHEGFDEKMWFLHGGEATALSYQNKDEATKKKHIQYLKSLQNYYLLQFDLYLLFLLLLLQHLNHPYTVFYQPKPNNNLP